MLAQSAVMRLHVSVSPSVRNVQVPCSNRLEFFENNFTAEYSLRPLLWLTPNMGDLVQREHPQKLGLNRGRVSIAHKTCSSSETVQDRTKVTITD